MRRGEGGGARRMGKGEDGDRKGEGWKDGRGRRTAGTLKVFHDITGAQPGD